MARKFKLPSETSRRIFNLTLIADRVKPEEILKDKCFVEAVYCDPCSPFRSITGYCNNLKKPELGSAYSLFLRHEDNAYDDSKTSFWLQ